MNKILFVILFNLFCLAAQAQDGIGIIANEIGMNQMSKQEAKDIFKGKYTFWKNGSKVIIVLPSSKNPVAANSSKILYNTNPDGVKRYWLSMIFQGRSSSPVFLDTDKEIIDFVEKNSGAIGVISEDNLKKADEKYRVNLN